MTGQANKARGEAALRVGGEALVIRPTFQALLAAEEELGSLFALVDRAAAGELGLREIVVLFWHAIDKRPDWVTREAVGEAVLSMGLAQATPVLREVLKQILMGR